MFSLDTDGGATSGGPTSGPNGSNGPGGKFLFSSFCDFSVKFAKNVCFGGVYFFGMIKSFFISSGTMFWDVILGRNRDTNTFSDSD